MRKICFATGNIHTWVNKLDRQIDYIRKIDVDGVEITLGRPDEIKNLKISSQNKKFLKQKRVTIHSPFGLRRLQKQKLLESTIQSVEEMYQDLEAEAVVVHPAKELNFDLFEKARFKVLIENLMPRKKLNHTYYSNLLKKYKKFGFILDAAHAYLFSDKETEKLIGMFDKRIKQFHFSGTYRHQEHHTLFDVTQRFWKSVEPVKKHKAPIVMEGFFPNRDINAVREEVKLVREWAT